MRGLRRPPGRAGWPGRCYGPRSQNTRAGRSSSPPPHGYNWFYDLYRDAEQEDGWERFHYPTSTNPHIPPAELAQLTSELGAVRYAEEIEARFTSDAAHPFRPEWFSYYQDAGDHSILHTQQGPVGGAKNECPLVQAIDLAVSLKQTADYLAIVTVATTPQGERLVLDV